MNKYFFILGSNPALSLAELDAVLGIAENDAVVGGEVLIWNTQMPLDPAVLIRRLGGTIKIARFAGEATKEPRSLVSNILPALKPGGKKFNFGISPYGLKNINVKALAMEIKKNLKERGVICRWVASKDRVLSSVVVEQNGLTKDGAEIVLCGRQGKILVGQTLAVQAFKELSFRDYGRPARDDLSGMLPPKLAQIMINLARAPKDGTLLDPFCGSGTILSEAALLGYRHLVGTDISDKAVADTKKNLAWIADKLGVADSEIRVEAADSRNISTRLPADSVDAIVTEPFLGPRRGRVDLRGTVKKLEELYQKSLEEFYKVLKQNGRVVMIWPVFNTGADRIFIKNVAGSFQVVPPLPASISANFKLSNRQTIVYGRPEQKVWREIVILEK